MSKKRAKPFYQRGWFLAIVGAAALVGAVTTLVVTGGKLVDFVRGDNGHSLSAIDIEHLRAGLQVDEFRKVLGDPPIEKQHDGLTEYVFEQPAFYVQVITDGRQVVVFSLTVREPSFVLDIPQFRTCYSGERPPPIRLGRTRFSGLAEYPTAIRLYAFANGRHAYSEFFGGTGACTDQIYILSHNRFGYAAIPDDAPSPVYPRVGQLQTFLLDSGAAPPSTINLPMTTDPLASGFWDARPLVGSADFAAVRADSVINTYTETVPGSDLQSRATFLLPFLTRGGGLDFGPTENDVVVLTE